MKYKSNILEMIHENAMANFEIGAISEARMQEYDEMCLVKTPDPVYKTEQTEEPEKLTSNIKPLLATT
ncbi:MAG: hypothetical protein FWG89_02450 [Treponema sp.]|nr:hypothetical protein [Treponema sp.]